MFLILPRVITSQLVLNKKMHYLRASPRSQISLKYDQNWFTFQIQNLYRVIKTNQNRIKQKRKQNN